MKKQKTNEINRQLDNRWTHDQGDSNRTPLPQHTPQDLFLTTSLQEVQQQPKSKPHWLSHKPMRSLLPPPPPPPTKSAMPVTPDLILGVQQLYGEGPARGLAAGHAPALFSPRRAPPQSGPHLLPDRAPGGPVRRCMRSTATHRDSLSKT